MTEPCPSPDLLERYLRQTLADDESDRLRPHVVGCRTCQAALTKVYLSVFGREARRRSRHGAGWIGWLATTVPWGAVVVVLVALILLLGVAGLLYLVFQKT